MRAAFNYDPAEGILRWKVRPEMPAKWNTRWAGKPAGCRNWAGYTQVCIFYRMVMAHRLIWLMTHGEWPPEHIDHINRDPSDNRLANLRLADTQQNGWNSGMKPSNTSGFKGVTKCLRTGRWTAKIRVNGTRHSLGTFLTVEEAGAAYTRAAEHHHGEFACPT